jgi:hypothetical protein
VKHLSFAVLFAFVISAASSAQELQKLVKLAYIWPAEQNAERLDCLEVYVDGSFVLERRHSDFLDRTGSKKTYSGKLVAEGLGELNAILKDPKLIALGNAPKDVLVGYRDYAQAEFLKVLIDRQSGSQFLIFDSGLSKPPLPSLNRTPAIKPLFSWYKQLSRSKNAIDPKATVDCSGRWSGE